MKYLAVILAVPLTVIMVSTCWTVHRAAKMLPVPRAWPYYEVEGNDHPGAKWSGDMINPVVTGKPIPVSLHSRFVQVPPTATTFTYDVIYDVKQNVFLDRPHSVRLPPVTFVDNPAAHFTRPLAVSGIAFYAVLIPVFFFGDKFVRGEWRSRRRAVLRGFPVIIPAAHADPAH